MPKKEALQELVEMREKVKYLKTFKGRAAVVNQIENSISFIRGYKVEDSLCERLVLECELILANGIEVERIKYEVVEGGC